MSRPAPVPGLMAALQASVEAVGRFNERWDGDEEPKPKPKRARKPAAPAAKAEPRKRASTRPASKKS